MIDHFSGTSEIRIGGGELVVAFFEEAFRLRVKRLVVLTPYVDESVFAYKVFMNLWQRTSAIAESTNVVRRTSAADAILRLTQLVKRQCCIRINPRLHAKVFLAWRPGAELALVGSHNLTGAALRVNKEIGVLMKPTGSQMRVIASHLRAAVEVVVSRVTYTCNTEFIPPLPDQNPAVTALKQ